MKEHDLIPKHADAMHPSVHLELGDCGMGMPVISELGRRSKS